MKILPKMTLGVVVMMILAGCQFQLNNGDHLPDAVFTSAALTMQVELTKIASPSIAFPTQTPIVPPTPIIISTNTPSSSPTDKPIPCNRATYDPVTIDVTIPDGTNFLPGTSFTKTWRLTNSGTCTWTSNYQLTFHTGDTFGVPAGYAQALTSGSIPPGGSIDVSVPMKTPMVAGSYKGFWRLREPGGQYFGIGNSGGNFWVSINVLNNAVLQINQVPGESGSVRSDGTVKPDVLYIGDTNSNVGSQTFLSFDISSIPNGVTITHVKLDIFQGLTIVGDPFSTLGCLYFYSQNYGTLDPGDFTLTPPPGGLVKQCGSPDLQFPIVDDADFINGVQARVGTTRFQIRLQFPSVISDMNGANNLIRISKATLEIAYKLP